MEAATVDKAKDVESVANKIEVIEDNATIDNMVIIVNIKENLKRKK